MAANSLERTHEELGFDPPGSFWKNFIQTTTVATITVMKHTTASNRYGSPDSAAKSSKLTLKA